MYDLYQPTVIAIVQQVVKALLTLFEIDLDLLLIRQFIYYDSMIAGLILFDFGCVLIQ